MIKKGILHFIVFICVAAIAILATVPYSFVEKDNSRWMSKLEDDRALNTLAIPGTHDSGALYSMADLFGKCQSLSIAEQLQVGVRFFDIRLRLVGDELKIYHNIVDQKLLFADVLAEFVAFLEENPDEFMFLILKEEVKPAHSKGAFAEVLENLLHSYPDIISTQSSVPASVGDARGKIFIITRYEDAGIGFSCEERWEKNTSFAIDDIFIQDFYKINHAEEKIKAISQAFALAEEGRYKLVFNFISCYFDTGFPPSYAGNTAHAVNDWVCEYLQAEKAVGVVSGDFMTSELADLIIGSNFK